LSALQSEFEIFFAKESGGGIKRKST